MDGMYIIVMLSFMLNYDISKYLYKDECVI